MRTAVVQLPRLNRDHDMISALEKLSGKPSVVIWQTESDIPDIIDLIVIPGGFSYGDYLRCGAIAAHTPVMQAVKKRPEQGVKVLGICNGFQILLELGLLPGALIRNSSLKFVCKEVSLEVTNAETAFTRIYSKGQIIRCPVAHYDGNYFTDLQTLSRLKGEGLIVFRYAAGRNPNGSLYDIAGIVNPPGNVLGMMPHPENMLEAAHGGTDGYGLFASVLHMVSGGTPKNFETKQIVS